MLTISLDETNGFEDWCASESAVFVGGVIYDDEGDLADSSAERQRIIKYYTNVIEDSLGDRSLFPKALHCGNGTDESVREVKEEIRKSFGEFIKDGTYKGKALVPRQRHGKYYLFVNMKSDTGVSELVRDATNKLSRDDYASNLYFHMATGIVDRLVFHNPLIPYVKEVSFNLPSRASRDFDSRTESDIVEQYKKIGYKKEQRNNKGNGEIGNSTEYYMIAGPEMYRVALAQKMIQSGKTAIDVKEFRVQSINYNYSSNMEFLYLADSLCSIVSNKLGGKDAAGWINAIDQKISNLNDPDRNMVFVYDDIDVKYADAWAAYEKGDLYSALELTHNAEQYDGVFAAYYKKKWFKKLRERIGSTRKLECLADAVNELGRPIRSNVYSQDCGLDIFKSLEKIADNNEDEIIKSGRERLLCQLYSHGISVYCHMGDSKNAQKYFNKYKKYRHLLKPDEYTSALMRLTEVELDQFQWDKAEKNSQDCIDMLEMLSEMAGETDVFGDGVSLYSSELGKAYSLMGQVLAFKRNENAEDYFMRALENFKKDGPDYKITQSYLLHHYIDMGQRDKFEKEAADYFGGESSASKRLTFILKNAFEEYPVINYRYALYVFIKGLYTFAGNSISEDLYKKLIGLNDQLKKAEVKVKGKKGSFIELKNHPSEIIYKYIAMMARDRGDDENASKYINKAFDASEDDGTIISLIRRYGAKEFYASSGETDKENEMNEEINALLRNSLLGGIQEIEGMLTYMYR